MSRLECVGKSSSGSQKQFAAEVPFAHAETNKPNDKLGKKAVSDKPSRRYPAPLLPRSVQQTQRSGFSSGVLNTDERSQKESRDITPRVEKKAQSTSAPDDELKMKDMMKAQPPDSAVTGGPTHAPPAAKPLPIHGGNGKEEETEEEDVQDEDLKAPVELILKFLRAVMDRDFQLASKLCQMILIYEPDNPEASEFLPLIQKKLLEEQEAEQSTEEEEEDDEEDDKDDDDEDDENDDDDEGDNSSSEEESSQRSSCSSSSCSSSSPSDEEEEEEKPVNRHKPCPPSHICP